MAGEQREVTQRPHIVGAVLVFQESQHPTNLRTLCFCVVVRELTDQLRRHPRLAGSDFQRPRLTGGDVFFESGGRVLNERVVGQSGVDDLTSDTVGQRDVGSDVETEPRVSPLRRFGAAWIDRIDLGAFMNRLQRVMKENRMRFAGIGAPEDKQIRIFSFAIRRSTTARSEYRHQTGDAGSVSSSVTGIDVVRADHRPGELLGNEVQLVGRARAREHAERVGAVLLAVPQKAFCGATKSFVPRSRPQDTIIANQRLGESGVILLTLSGHMPASSVFPRSIPYITIPPDRYMKAITHAYFCQH